MKKSDLQLASSRYHGILKQAIAAEHQGHYAAAVAYAVSAFGYIDSMLRYANQYEDRQVAVLQCVEMVLEFAPLIFDAEGLEAIENLLATKKRVRVAAKDLAGDLVKARSNMWNNYRLWSHIESVFSVKENELSNYLGGRPDQWKAPLNAWEKMRLIRRFREADSYHLALVTRMDELMQTKCAACGRIATRPKAAVLSPIKCSDCGIVGIFVILS